MKQTPLILIDTRENLPWEFPGFRSKVQMLKAGDYSLYGYTKLITVERKSLGDFALSSRNMDRFKKGQLAKLLKLTYACIIVEGDPSIARYSKYYTPETIISKSCDIILHGVPILFCGTRDMASYACLEFLMKSKNLVDGA